MQNTHIVSFKHWFPGEENPQGGSSLYPKHLFGPDFWPDAVLKGYVRGIIKRWLITIHEDQDLDAPKTIAAKIVFRGEAWTASAKIEEDAEIQIEKAE